MSSNMPNEGHSKNRYKNNQLFIKNDFRLSPTTSSLRSLITGLYLLTSVSLVTVILAGTTASANEDISNVSELTPSVLNVASYNESNIIQNGTRNTATISQIGDGNRAQISQLGSQNEAISHQQGFNNDLLISQAGNDHYARIEQIGDGHSNTIEQSGRPRQLESIQVGFGAQTEIYQVGGASSSPLSVQQYSTGAASIRIVQ